MGGCHAFERFARKHAVPQCSTCFRARSESIAPMRGVDVLDGPTVLNVLTRAGITDVAWIPDSELGTWESALCNSASIRLIRVCREGEAFAVAAGLLLGGRRP